MGGEQSVHTCVTICNMCGMAGIILICRLKYRMYGILRRFNQQLFEIVGTEGVTLSVKAQLVMSTG